MYAVIDTATEFIAIEGHECTTCGGVTHDIRKGLDSGDAGISADISTEPYGSTILEGKWGFDKICIALNQCILFQDFFYISTAYFLAPVDGVIGLARPNAPMILNPEATPKEKKFLLD